MLKEIAAGAAALTILSVTTSEVLSTNVFGGPGGSDFRYVCERNGYLVGVEVRGGNWIDSVRAICATYNPKDGRLYGAAPEGPVFGGPGGGRMQDMSWYLNECKRQEYIYSFDVAEPQKFRYVGQLRFACFSSVTGKRPAGNPHRIIIKGNDALKGTQFDTCPEGRAAMGIRGRAGSYVDAFGLICGPIGHPAAPQTQVKTNGPGDTTFVFPTQRSKIGVTHLLDVCLSYGKDCGKVAAESFCREQKFKYLVSFEQRPNAGHTVLQRGDPDICAGSHCVGFSEIRCAQTKPVASGPAGSGSIDVGGVAGKTAPLPPLVPPPPGGASAASGSKVGNGWNGLTHYLAADFTGDGKADLVVRRQNGDIELFPFDGSSFYGGGGPIKAGNGWNGFTHYFAADWSGDGKSDVLVRAANGDAFLFAMTGNGFYGGGPQKAAEGWQYTHYFAADFTGDGTPDIVGRTPDGDLMMLSTYALLLPSKVGDGWHFTHYFTGDFSGDGKADLLVRNDQGDLLLYPFGQNGFYDGGGPIKAGNGANFTHYWTGDWTGDGRADLLVRNASGDMLLYPMNSNTLYAGGGPIKVGNGWDFTHYFAADFSGDGRPDMVVRTQAGDLLYFPWKGSGF